jgi:hypothetical protein
MNAVGSDERTSRITSEVATEAHRLGADAGGSVDHHMIDVLRIRAEGAGEAAAPVGAERRMGMGPAMAGTSIRPAGPFWITSSSRSRASGGRRWSRSN